MYINNLIFEVTRKCNLKCRHCLRGCAQNLSMSKQTIQNTLKDVKGIGTIQFTGGEPSLGLYQIRTIVDVLLENEISIYNFWIKLNGTKYSEALLEYFNSLYENVDDKDMSMLTFSSDNYHKNSNKVINAYLNMQWKYPFINPPDRDNSKYLIREGRARKAISGVYYRQALYYNGWVTDEDIYPDRYECMAMEYPVYISANGNVISGCDLSFDHIDKYSFGNVNKEPLKSIISKHLFDSEEIEKINI